jgi:hypothetical protein
MTEATQGNDGNGADQPRRARSSTERSRAHRARKKREREAALQKAEAERVVEAPATETAAAGDVAGDVASSRNTVAGAAPGSAEQKEEREAAALHETEKVEREAGATETATIERVADVTDAVASVGNAVSVPPPVAAIVASFGNGVPAPLKQPEWRILPPVERSAKLPVVPVWLRWSFGGLSVLLSFALFSIGMIANMLVWAGPDPTENRKAMIFAAAAFVTEVVNYAIPSVISFASSQLVRRGAWVIWFAAMVIAATGGAAFVKDNLGAAEVSRQTNNDERDRLTAIINSVAKPISDASVVAAREKRDAAKAVAKSDCPRNKSLDLELCNKSKAAWMNAEDDLKQANETHDADVRAAEVRHRKDVADAQAKLDRLPVISADKNVVLAGVTAIVPGVPEAWVNRLVVALWIVMFNLGSCVLLRLGVNVLAAPRTTSQSRGGMQQ